MHVVISFGTGSHNSFPNRKIPTMYTEICPIVRKKPLRILVIKQRNPNANEKCYRVQDLGCVDLGQLDRCTLWNYLSPRAWMSILRLKKEKNRVSRNSLQRLLTNCLAESIVAFFTSKIYKKQESIHVISYNWCVY